LSPARGGKQFIFDIKQKPISEWGNIYV
jgi:hypothetical protein